MNPFFNVIRLFLWVFLVIIVRTGCNAYQYNQYNKRFDVKPTVLVNAKSGGGAGKQLLHGLLPLNQSIVDLRLVEGFDAASIQTNATVVCCGGDGTLQLFTSIARRAGLVVDCKVGIIPLGTGNDMFNHLVDVGGNFNDRNLTSSVLDLCNTTRSTIVDSWTVETSAPDRRKLSKFLLSKRLTKPITEKFLWSKFIKSSRTTMSKILKKARKDRSIQYFNNYFGIGIDSAMTYEFDSFRRQLPSFFWHPWINKAWYGLMWIYSLLRGDRRNLLHQLELYCDGEKVDLPSKVAPFFGNGSAPQLQGIIMANIGSYAGGCRLWDAPYFNQYHGRLSGAWLPQQANDSMIEVVGVLDMTHLARVTTGIARSIPLAQGRSIKVPMQIDGEPWKQRSCALTVRSDARLTMLLPPNSSTT